MVLVIDFEGAAHNLIDEIHHAILFDDARSLRKYFALAQSGLMGFVFDSLEIDPTHILYNDKNTMAAHAACLGYTEILAVLADVGADLNTADEYGNTPTYWAIFNRDTAAVRILADAGADLSSANDSGYTPADWAAYNDDHEILQILADSGADLSAQDQDGDTPAHTAALFGNTQALRVLAEAGADVTSLNENGYMPADWAIIDNDAESLDIILSAASKDKNQMKAVIKHLQNSYGYSNLDTSVQDVLEKHGIDTAKDPYIAGRIYPYEGAELKVA